MESTTSCLPMTKNTGKARMLYSDIGTMALQNNLTDKTKRMTQKEKTLVAREAFYNALNAAKISVEDFNMIASKATTWAVENYNEGIDTGRDIAHKYAVTATSTHGGTATVVEPVSDVATHSMNIV